jgi:hypothetical protein
MMPTATARFAALLKPKRTWLQFRLRTIFVLVVIVAVPFGWFKWKSDRMAREREAVAKIKSSRPICEIGAAEIFDFG